MGSSNSAERVLSSAKKLVSTPSRDALYTIISKVVPAGSCLPFPMGGLVQLRTRRIEAKADCTDEMSKLSGAFPSSQGAASCNH